MVPILTIVVIYVKEHLFLSREVTNTWFGGIMEKETPAKNGQVIIKASTDRGKTFGDKINLSNST